MCLGCGLKKTISILKGCEAIICNDTGLAHVAAAMRKKHLIILKSTPTQCLPRTKKTSVIYYKDAKNGITEFVNSLV